MPTRVRNGLGERCFNGVFDDPLGVVRMLFPSIERQTHRSMITESPRRVSVWCARFIDSPCALVATTLLATGLFNCAVQADDIDYSTVGGWSVQYRKQKISGCIAWSNFQDKTNPTMGLYHLDANKKIWVIVVSNPKWNSWTAKKN